MLAVIQTGIPAADLPKIKKLGGVRAVLSVSGGAIKINGKRVNVIGVNPGQFRSWTSPTTAGEHGPVAGPAPGQSSRPPPRSGRSGWSKGHAYPAVAARPSSLTFGGSAALSVPGVDAVVNQATARPSSGWSPTWAC